MANIANWLGIFAKLADFSASEKPDGEQRVQVVAVNDEVAVEPGVADRFQSIRNQWPVGYGKVVVENKLLALEAQFWHD